MDFLSLLFPVDLQFLVLSALLPEGSTGRCKCPLGYEHTKSEATSGGEALLPYIILHLGEYRL
jgi:hypothetical protein